MNEKNQVNPKPVVVSNIPNDKLFIQSLSFLDQADAALASGRDSSARKILRKIKPSLLPIDVRGEYYEKFASLCQREGNYREGFRSLKKAQSILQKSNQPFALSRSYLQEGALLRQLEKFSNAYRAYNKGQTIAARLANKNVPGAMGLTLEAAMGKALAKRGEGRFLQAAQWFRDLIPPFSALNDQEGVAYARWALGTTERFLGNFSSAKKNLAEAVRLYKKLNASESLAYARCALGGTLRMMGEPAESARLYKKANAVFRQKGDLFGQAYSFCGQASAARVQGQFAKANPFFKQAIRLYKKIDQKGPLGFVLWGQAQQFLNTQQRKKALSAIQTARSLFAQAKDPRGKVYVDLALGQYHHRFQPQKSKRYFRSAYQGAKKLNLLFEMGHAKRGLGDTNPWPYYALLGANPKKLAQYIGFP